MAVGKGKEADKEEEKKQEEEEEEKEEEEEEEVNNHLYTVHYYYIKYKEQSCKGEGNRGEEKKRRGVDGKGGER